MYDRLLIAGTHSGCGKTTVTCALLGALKQRGVSLRSFKCGPDYIDPMFHREVLGIPAQNLDPFFSTPQQLAAQVGAQCGALSVIEGVMGYYDGIGAGGEAGTWHAACATQTPAVLVVDTRGAFTSVGAVVHGFRTFRPNSGIVGVIFNGLSPALYPAMRQIARDAGVVPCGFLPRSEAVSVARRHLGLVSAGEIGDLREKLALLTDMAEQYLDIDALLALASAAPALNAPEAVPAAAPCVRIAVARDEAFCFLYEENLELLRQLGCELLFFSPLRDRRLPEGIGGLYLPGGYPELHAQALSANPVRHEIAGRIADGLPTIAECGGFLYLHDALDDVPMAGVIHARAEKTPRLQHFGYVTLRSEEENLLCAPGDAMRCHEFHYYESTDNGNSFTAYKPSGTRGRPCVHATASLYAGFPHLYFPACKQAAARFVRKAAQYAAV